MKQNHWPHIETKADYTRFRLAYEQGTKGITHLSSGIQDADICPECEGFFRDSFTSFFSHNPCDICSRALSGNRYIAHGIINKGGYLIHLEICSDCEYYMEYGTLDDSTMERIEHEETKQTKEQDSIKKDPDEES